MLFSELGLRSEILEAMEILGYKEPTPIQEAVIPQILKGKDVSGLAQTGTGKTGAFVIPLLNRWLTFKDDPQSDWKVNNYFLILVPTRELATQVKQAVEDIGQKCGVKTACIFGGAGYDDQKRALQNNPTFVVGTPGRLLDLYKSHDLDLNAVKAVVFDEADRMFDMGFKDDMKFILRRLPRNRQFLFFSATLNFDVLNTAYQFGAEPIEYNISRDQATAEGIEHEILHIGHDEKPMYLLSTLKKYAPQQCIVFSNFKNHVGRIAKFLKINGIEATAMSSLLSQTQRNKVLEAFKTGKKAILVATDVAARGLDIKGVDLVINYELPDDPEGYVHRIGRTGRAGTQGKALGLVGDRDVDALQRIETYLKEKIKTGWFEDSDLIRDFKPFPAFDDFKDDFGEAPSQQREQKNFKPHGERDRGGRPPHHHKPRYEGNGKPAGGGGGQHRDRHTGRHQGKPHHGGGQRQQLQRQPHGHKPRHQQHQKNQDFKRRPLHKPHHAAKSASHAPAANKSASITDKIKNFILRLFN